MGLQFFAIPEKFINDHFEAPVDAMHVFLARGSGIAIAGVAYAMHKFDVPLKLLVAYNAMVGLVYPWNAAYISKLPVKYPMHFLPEPDGGPHGRRRAGALRGAQRPRVA